MFSAFSVSCIGSQAGREGDRAAGRDGVPVEGGHKGIEAVHRQHALVQPGDGQDDAEGIFVNPAETVQGAQQEASFARDRLQHGVADRFAVQGIDAFHAVDADDGEAEWLAGARRAQQFIVDQFGKAAAVMHAGEYVVPHFLGQGSDLTVFVGQLRTQGLTGRAAFAFRTHSTSSGVASAASLPPELHRIKQYPPVRNTIDNTVIKSTALGGQVRHPETISQSGSDLNSAILAKLRSDP
ncbi:hypothetical protein LP420_33015 [Massilia sp. B-10]|nr:hypothetical protein LP420_33015 [Massilia sp. B-10]